MSKATTGKTQQSPMDVNAIETVGELFVDGHQIEILADPTHDYGLRLLYWNGHSARVGSRFEHGGHIYRAATLSRSFLLATRLPVRQGKRIRVGSLVARIANEIRKRLRLPADDADRIAFYCVSTWFPDVVSTLPLLLIVGMDPCYGFQTLRLIACFCRRPLILAGVPHNAFGFVADASPTLLIFDPRMSATVGAALQASNLQGLLSLDRTGVHNYCFSKAVFWQPSAVDPSILKSGVLQISLGAVPAGALELADRELRTVADEFQPLLLTYRLENCTKVRESRFDVPEFTFPTRATAAALGKCLREDPRLTRHLIELLRWQDQAARSERSIDPDASLVEILRGCLDTGLETNTNGPTSVQEIARLLNTLLRSRGAIQEYSPEDVGRMLKRLGVPRTRSAAGMRIIRDDETARRVHSLSRSYGISTTESRELKCRECDGVSRRVGV